MKNKSLGECYFEVGALMRNTGFTAMEQHNLITDLVNSCPSDKADEMIRLLFEIDSAVDRLITSVVVFNRNLPSGICFTSLGLVLVAMGDLSRNFNSPWCIEQNILSVNDLIGSSDWLVNQYPSELTSTIKETVRDLMELFECVNTLGDADE